MLVKFQVQQVRALRTITATTAITVKEPRYKKTVKERNLQRTTNRATSQCSDVDAELEQNH